MRQSNSLEPSGSSLPVMGLVGGSGCGKTTLVNGLIARFPGMVTVLSQDLYYHDLSLMPLGERAQVNFDCPDALDADLIATQIEQLSTGRPVQAPVYDFSHHIRVGWQTIHPANLLLVEGTLLLAMPTVGSRLDFTVFVDTPDTVRLQRRIERDQAERGRKREDIERQYERMVRPMYEKYIAPTQDRADLIVDGERPLCELIEQLYQEITRRFTWSWPAQFH